MSDNTSNTQGTTSTTARPQSNGSWTTIADEQKIKAQFEKAQKERLQQLRLAQLKK